jgi:hypothetical protein
LAGDKKRQIHFAGDKKRQIHFAGDKFISRETNSFRVRQIHLAKDYLAFCLRSNVPLLIQRQFSLLYGRQNNSV